MKPYIDTSIGVWNSYDVIITAGSMIMASLAFFLFYQRTKDIKYSFLVCLLGTVLVLSGSVVGNFIRGLNGADYGEGQYIWKYLFQHNGDHFIGRVLLVTWVFPPGYRMLFKKQKSEYLVSFDIICISMAFQHIFNRFACFMKGCCRGKFYDGFWGITFPMSTEYNDYSYPVYPTQLFEMLCMVILFVILLRRFKAGKRCCYIFLLAFAVTIFLSELMMSDEGVLHMYGLSAIQYAAGILILSAAGIFIFDKKQQ